MPTRVANRPLSVEERQKLLAMLEESRKRGKNLAIGTYTLSGKNISPFHRDSRGYFVANDGKQFHPTDSQKGFYDSRGRFIGFIGSRGSGKTTSGAQKAIDKIAKGQIGMVINPSFEIFKTSTWPELRKWIPWNRVLPKHQYRKREDWEAQKPFIIAFDNGAWMLCKGLKDPSSARGPNMNWLWFDEAQEDETGMAWKIAVACVRVGEEPQAWATYTPRGSYHWTTRFFINQEIPKDITDLFGTTDDRELVESFHGTMDENKGNLDPGFIAAMLMAYPDTQEGRYLREREVFGHVADEGGALGSRLWFDGKIIPSCPEDVKSRIRYHDLAASEKKLTGKKKNDPDETSGTRLSWDGDNKFCIEHQVNGHWAWQKIKENIAQTAQMDGPYVPIYIEQEPGAGGINQVEELKIYIRDNVGIQWKVEGHRPEGDKIIRAQPWFAEAANGQFTMVAGDWNNGFLDQLSGFPVAPHDDRVDSVSGARQIIAPFKTWKNIPFLSLGSLTKKEQPATA